jgi:hypothetical protein
MRFEPIAEWDRRRRGLRPRRADFTGYRHPSGRTTGVEAVAVDQWGNVVWRCRCDCGEPHLVSSSNLRTGMVKSCGCGRRHAQTKVS